MLTPGEATLASLRRVPGTPLWTARYRGDYRLGDLATRGIGGPHRVEAFFEDLFASLGHPVRLSGPPHPGPGVACSAFASTGPDGPLVGKNLDWRDDPVLVLKTVPAQGYSSLSLVDRTVCDPFGLGSAVHDLILSPFVPFDGINDRGLVVSLLAVEDQPGYPPIPDRPLVGDLHLVRILLDTCATVAEAAAVADRYALVPMGPLPVHLLVADGLEARVLEFSGEKVSVGPLAPWVVVTNLRVNPPGGQEPGRVGCPRFRLLEAALTGNPRVSDLRAKALLAHVAVFSDGPGPRTLWSVVYSPHERSLKVRLGQRPGYHRFTLGGPVGRP